MLVMQLTLGTMLSCHKIYCSILWQYQRDLSPTTLFNINAPSILKWIYISCVRTLLAAKYAFHTFPRIFRLLTSSQRDFRCNSLMTFVIVSTFVHLQFRLRGCIRYVNIERWLWALINRIMTTYLYDVYVWLSDQWKGTA
jgi:hypothetical protein